MTNAEFLRAVFGQSPRGHVFTTGFRGDPAEQSSWGRRPLEDPEANNYVCVSTLVDPWGPRSPENFEALYMLVIDDVFAKVDPTLLPCPTYVLATSERNFQYGYVFDEPITDSAVANGLINAAARRVKINDARGVNRLVRTPEGRNGKPGKNNFKCDMAWDGRLHYADDLIDFFGAVPEPIEYTDDGDQSYLPQGDDPVIQALLRNGHRVNSPVGKKYDIECPWVHEHTGRVDNGAAYMAPAGFKCHHGHCEDKTFADLREYLGIPAEAIDAVQEHLALSKLLDGEVEPAPAPPPPPELASAARFFNRHGGRLRPEEFAREHPREWVFDDLLLSNSVWTLYGPGGLGKSRLALVLAMCAATGQSYGPLRPGNKDGVKTLFATFEDDEAEKGHRFLTQLEYMASEYPEWNTPQVAERLAKNLIIPDLDPVEGMSKRVYEAIAEEHRKSPFQLTIFDPLILFIRDEDMEEGGLNSATVMRATFKMLLGLTRSTKVPASVGLLHHANKQGDIMGSVMVTNMSRSVLSVEEEEQYEPQGDEKIAARLKLTKANAIRASDHENIMVLIGDSAVVDFKDKFTISQLAAQLAAEEEAMPEDRVFKAVRELPFAEQNLPAGTYYALLAARSGLTQKAVKEICASAEVPEDLRRVRTGKSVEKPFYKIVTPDYVENGGYMFKGD